MFWQGDSIGSAYRASDKSNGVVLRFPRGPGVSDTVACYGVENTSQLKGG